MLTMTLIVSNVATTVDGGKGVGICVREGERSGRAAVNDFDVFRVDRCHG